MKEQWLMPGAMVPVDVETTAALVAEIKRLIGVVGDMALKQAEKQEPVAWINWNAATGERTVSFVQESELASEPLYTSPPPRQPLTDEEILAIARNHYNPYQRAEISFSRAIEAAHGIKENT